MSDVVARFPWTTIKQRRPHDGLPAKILYDLWEWNVWKMKWVRVVSSCGFWQLEYALQIAGERSNEIEQMLKNNQNHPFRLD